MSITNLEYNVSQALHVLKNNDNKTLAVAYLVQAQIAVRDLDKKMRGLINE